MFVEKLLLDDEIERIQNLSDKELDDETCAEGLAPSHVPSADKLMAQVKRPATERDAAGKTNDPTRIARTQARRGQEHRAGGGEQPSGATGARGD
jgi:hypothetical protein